MHTNTHKGKEAEQHLRDEVLRQLQWEPRVTPTNINAAVVDNVVTLTGSVHTYA
ncbi:MAG TPA: BON domain-containing protein [Bryobacteraceae bacterium]|nr:BON domain-containing protein [Bryobacteraceae bacterium]